MFAARENLTKDILGELNRKLSPHGYVVRSMLVTDINPSSDQVVRVCVFDLVGYSMSLFFFFFSSLTPFPRA